MDSSKKAGATSPGGAAAHSATISTTGGTPFSADLAVSLFENSNDAVILHQRGNLIAANRQAASLTGIEQSELVGMRVADLVADHARALAKEMVAAVTATGSVRFETQFKTKDGDIIDAEVSASVVDPSEGIIQSIVRDITERKRAAEALKLSDETFSIAFQASPGLVALTDKESGRIQKVNDAFLAATGHSREETVGRTTTEINLWPTADERQRVLQQLVKGVTVETQMRTRTGELRSVLLSAREIELPGQAPALITTATDITARKQAEDALRQSESRLQAFYDAAFEGLAITDKGRFVDCNQRFANTFGYTRQELLGREVMDLVHPDDRDLVIDRIRSGYVGPYEHRGLHRDGSVLDLEVKGRPSEYEGRPIRLTAIHDITDRTKAVQALRDSEKKLKEAQAIAKVGHWTLNLNTLEVMGSDELFRIFGVAREGATLEHFATTGLTENQSLGIEEVKEWLQRREPWEYERRIVTGAGDGDGDGDETTRDIRAKGTPVFGDDGEVVELVGIVQDITKKKAAERAWQAEQEFNEEMLDALADTVFVFAPKTGEPLRWNRAFARASGYSDAEIASMRAPDDWYDAEDLERAAGATAALAEAGLVSVEMSLVTKSGAKIPTDYRATMIEDEDGEPKYIISVGRDITERKIAEQAHARAEDQLRVAQKLDALGTLAGGIAHDFNNILAAILGHSDLGVRDQSASPQTRESFREIMLACQRAKGVVGQILTFARKTEHEAFAAPLHKPIKEALNLLRASLPSTIDIRSQLHCETPVLADPTRIHQVIMNLCTNAGLAMREHGGTLRIELMDVQLDEDFAAQHVDLNPGPHVRLTVNDTGCGIPPDVVERIFEPFYSTRDKSEGTGLGLAVVHGIIRDCDGLITVQSEVARGTTFEIYLPAATATATPDTAETAELPAGSGRVLVVDDEPALLRVLTRMLARLGYLATPATSGPAALDLFQKTPHDFDLVITDMTMPHMTGQILARQIRTVRPDIPVIIATGYHEKISDPDNPPDDVSEILPKPFELDTLATTLSKVMGRR